MAAGVLQEQSVASNAYGGLSGSEYYFDLVDITAPTAPDFSPAHTSVGQSLSTAIVLTFSETMQVCVCAGMSSLVEW